MSLIDSFQYSFKYFCRNKKILIMSLLISISLSLIIFSFSFHKSVNDYWTDSVTKLVDYRTFFVYYDSNDYDEKTAMEKLKQHNHIESVSPFSSYLITMIANDYVQSDKNSAFFLIGAKEDPIEVYKGDNLSSYKKGEKVMICADNFYPYQERTVYETSKNNIKKFTARIGEVLPLSFIDSNEIEEFKLIGVYNAELNKTDGNLCYTSFETVSNLNLYYQKEFYSQKDALFPIIMIVDDVKNINDTLNNIEQDGFYTNGAVLGINSKVGEEIISIMKIITILIFILTLGVIIFISFKTYSNRKKTFGILKTVGFKDGSISSLYYFQTVYQITLVIILSTILSYTHINLFKMLFLNKNLIFNGMSFEVPIIYLIIVSIFLLVILLFLTFITNLKVKSSSIVDILKGHK